MLIPKYCQNKQHKNGKPEEDRTWHGERVGARWAHLPEQWRRWSALTTGHGPTVPGCQCARTREQLPSQPAGSHSASRREPLFFQALRLSCPPCGYKYPLICAHTHTQAFYGDKCLPASKSKPKTFVTEVSANILTTHCNHFQGIISCGRHQLCHQCKKIPEGSRSLDAA